MSTGNFTSANGGGKWNGTGRSGVRRLDCRPPNAQSFTHRSIRDPLPTPWRGSCEAGVPLRWRNGWATGPAVQPPACPKTTFSVPTTVVPRPLVELAVGYGLSAETADASEQNSGDEPGYGVSHRILRKDRCHLMSISPQRVTSQRTDASPKRCLHPTYSRVENW